MKLTCDLVAGVLLLGAVFGCAQSGSDQSTIAGTRQKRDAAQVVEAGCATCMFDMPGVSGCSLAVRIHGKCYLVEGSDIDAHGDAHAADGLCMTVRRAQAVGRIEGDVFATRSFRLLP